MTPDFETWYERHEREFDGSVKQAAWLAWQACADRLPHQTQPGRDEEGESASLLHLLNAASGGETGPEEEPLFV